jgi:hypothetical protein
MFVLFTTHIESFHYTTSFVKHITKHFAEMDLWD